MLTWPSARRPADVLLLGLFGLVAFLLVANELYEADLWWHLRGGEWILEHGRPPATDPFTFGSHDRPWIDLHWGYQVILCLLFRGGGVPALIAFGAAAVAAAAVVALAARPVGTALPLALCSWIPALILLSVRNQPRPEVFTLLFLSVYLAVLTHLDEHPRLAWLLPGVQLLWVNTHSLFILGPIVLGMWWFARACSWAWRRLRGQASAPASPRRWHVRLASLCVPLACLCNPYGIQGALFPLILFPKVTEAGNPYKETIGEFLSPRRVAALIGPGNVGNHWYFCAFYLLLLLVPVSFLFPALWHASRPPSHPASSPSRRWVAALAVSVALLLLRTLTLSPRGRPVWLVVLGEAVPLLALGAGVIGAVRLGRRSRVAAGLALCGGCGLAAWMGWLADYLLFYQTTSNPNPGPPALLLLAVAGVCAAGAIGLLLRSGGNLFGLLLAGAFAYLAVGAMYNWSRFGLVAGVLLGNNLGTWLGPLRFAWFGRLGLGCLLLAWVAAILTGVYPKWVQSDFGFREAELAFAHDAARFASQAAMPPRSVVIPLQAAPLYIYHAAPGHLTYTDTRLEIPALETFQKYMAICDLLNQGNPRGVTALESLRAPVVLIDHAGNAPAEATLLLHPHWRLVYYDALAAVFLARTDPALETTFPTLDLGGRHFSQPHARSVPDAPGAAGKEAQALFELAQALRTAPAARWTLRLPALLAALDRATPAVENEPTAETWLLLANAPTSFLPELRGPPRNALQGWDPESGLSWARATYCLQRGLEGDPGNAELLQALLRSYAARELTDAQREVAEQLRGGRSPEGIHSRQPPYPAPPQFPQVLTQLLENHQPAAAARLVEQALARGEANWDWPLTDRLAGVCLHLGRPAMARELWQRAKDPPSEAVRQARLGDASWVARDVPAAIQHYRQGRQMDPRLVEPCWALAWLYAERGEAGPALQACRDGLTLPLAPGLRDELSALEAMLRRYAP